MRVTTTDIVRFNAGDRLALTPDQVQRRARAVRRTGYKVGRHLVEVELTAPAEFKAGETVTVLALAEMVPDGLRPTCPLWRALWWLRPLLPIVHAGRAALRRRLFARTT